MKFYTTAELGKTRRLTPEGFLIIEGVKVARVGSMDYGSNEVPGIESLNGVVVMSRTAEDLFSPETIASFEGKPIIIPAGNVHTEGVDADNWDRYSVGHMQGVRPDGDYLIADLVINDAKAIERIDNGLRELSCGYEYMARQVKAGYGEQYEIRGNHLALVEKARGGSQLKIGDKKPMKIKNKLLRLFAHAAKAGDEEAMAEMAEEFEKEDVPEKGADENEERLAAMESKLDMMFKILEKLLATEEAEQATGDESEEEDESEEPMKAGDLQTITAGAALLAPGFKVNPKAKAGDEMKRILLASGESIKAVIGDSATLSGDAVTIAFNSAVAVQKANNNAKMYAGDSHGAAVGFEILRGK